MREIELLAPAKNLESGMLAINYGADAVYIGAERFGARAAASNTVADIKKLVNYAHAYRAKVFVALNTILYDAELADAEKLIHQIYEAGADALIIQDMGILKMNIPPIPLHASTQTNNYHLDRIRFLDELGFERIVLARELSLQDIKRIRNQTTTELEYFVHGALCVSLSGQCYFSQAITGRSANRGMCSQMCRHPYNLVDANGKKIRINSHLLSLKDLNLSDHISELIHAGVSSLKIEGRLKDRNYVKNVVSYYRKKLDEFLLSHSTFSKASSGCTDVSFVPDPERSFNRSSTSYFFEGRNQELVNPHTPKSMGKSIGFVADTGADYFTINTNDALHNGDGLCYIKNDALHGLRVEKILNGKVYVNDAAKLIRGLEIYRNHDHEFNKLLEADKAIRKISVSITVKETNTSITFRMVDEDGLSSYYETETLPEPAKNHELAIQNIIAQLSKSGSSIFEVAAVNANLKIGYFLRMSELNHIRRKLFDSHEQVRIAAFKSTDCIRKSKAIHFPKAEVDFSENISNKYAADFYAEHGVKKLEKALEISDVKENQLLMTTRYCVKYELGYCQRFQNKKSALAEPLYLEDQNRKYLLDFDCKNCMMKIKLHATTEKRTKS